MIRFDILKPIIAATLALAVFSGIVIFYIKLQDTTSLIATARNAAEQKKADADKLFAEAREAREIAKNAHKSQAAEAKIAEQKAETEYQTAVNAERRAQADADKMEAQARTAKQTALNAVLRSKAEAMKMVAAANDLQAKTRTFVSALRCPTNFPIQDCVEALQHASENGHWRNIEYVAKPPKLSAGQLLPGIAYNHNYFLGGEYNSLEDCSAFCATDPACKGGTFYPEVKKCFFVINELQSRTHPNDKAISFQMKPTASLEQAPKQQSLPISPSTQAQAEAHPSHQDADAFRVISELADGKLNLRDGPGTRHGIIAELPVGTLLHQIGACVGSDDGITRDPWCKVDWDGTKGWASSSGLERVQDANNSGGR